MFPVYFPTQSVSDSCPETFRICPYSDVKIHFESNWRNADNRNEEDHLKHMRLVNKGLIPDQEQPSSLILADHFIPFETGVIRLSVNRGRGDVAYGYDREKNTIITMDDRFRASAFTNCHYIATHSATKLSNYMMNAIARASGLKTYASLNMPTMVGFNYRNRFKEQEGPQCLDSIQRDGIDSPTDQHLPRGVAKYQQQWVEYVGTVATNINTGDVVTDKFDVKDSVAYLPTPQPWNIHQSNGFSFTESKQMHFLQYLKLNIQLDVECNDPKIGSRIFEGLGIEFDRYDHVDFTPDGKVDPKSFITGEKQFGVMKTHAWVVDSDLIEQFAKDTPVEKEDKNVWGLRNNEERRETAFRNFTSHILAINVGDKELTNEQLTHLTNQWSTTSALNFLMGDTKKAFFSSMSKETKEKRIETLLKYIKCIEMEVPIYTPRFTDGVNAQLNEVVNRLGIFVNDFSIINEYTRYNTVQFDDSPDLF